MPIVYIHLVVAIVAETIGTAALQASQQFTRLGPSLVVVAGYTIAFYFLSLALGRMSLGPVYAIWSGLGIVLIAAVGWLAFGQRPDLPAIVGMALIVAGVMIINLLSDSAHR